MNRLTGLFSMLAFASPALGITINWGSEFGSVNVQSDGGTRVSADFTIQLGTFDTGFAPSGANAGLWASNWNVIDEVLPGQHNSDFGYFTSELDLQNNNSPFNLGAQVYVWMFNDQLAQVGSEWLLYTNDSTDNTPGDNWIIPAAPGSQQTPPLSWRVSNASHVVFGGLDPDRTGATVPSFGDGIGTPPQVPFNLQTHTFIPEPSAAALGGLAALYLLRRRRPRNAPVPGTIQTVAGPASCSTKPTSRKVAP
jgi:hypothetical protein